MLGEPMRQFSLTREPRFERGPSTPAILVVVDEGRGSRHWLPLAHVRLEWYKFGTTAFTSR